MALKVEGNVAQVEEDLDGARGHIRLVKGDALLPAEADHLLVNRRQVMPRHLWEQVMLYLRPSVCVCARVRAFVCLCAWGGPWPLTLYIAGA